jgi:hypothetical protein
MAAQKIAEFIVRTEFHLPEEVYLSDSSWIAWGLPWPRWRSRLSKS